MQIQCWRIMFMQNQYKRVTLITIHDEILIWLPQFNYITMDRSKYFFVIFFLTFEISS